MNKKINLCIAGLGRAGNIHLNSISSLQEFNLQSLVDPDSAALEKTDVGKECRKIANIEEALKDENLDAVIVSSPTDSHYPLIMKSLEAGKHVFTEKPLGHTIEQVKNCYDLAARNKLALYLGFQRRYDRNFIALKDRLSELGDCRILKASSRDNPKPSMEYLRISGNIFHDMLIHDFDMLINLFGEKIPDSIYAIGYAHDRSIAELKDFDTVIVSLKYPDGMLCTIDTSRISPYGYDQRLEVFGEKGMIVAGNEPSDTIGFYTDSGLQNRPFLHSFPERYRDAYRLELIDFAKGIREGKLHNIPRRECLISHLIADAAMESASRVSIINFKKDYSAYLEP